MSESTIQYCTDYTIQSTIQMAVPLSWQFLCLFLLILLSECYGSSSPCASLVSKRCGVWLTKCLLSWLGMTWAVILAEGQSVDCFPSLLSQLWKAQLFNLSSDVIFFRKSFSTPQAWQGFLCYMQFLHSCNWNNYLCHLWPISTFSMTVGSMKAEATPVLYITVS